MRDFLSREREALAEFLEVLESERTALEQGEFERLETLAQAKLHCAAKLSEQIEQRASVLRGAGRTPDRNGMDGWLGASGDPAARELWAEIVSMTRRARDLNEANGAQIRERMKHNQAALDVLMSATRRASLYGPDGQSLAPGVLRPRDSA